MEEEKPLLEEEEMKEGETCESCGVQLTPATESEDDPDKCKMCA